MAKRLARTGALLLVSAAVAGGAKGDRNLMEGGYVYVRSSKSRCRLVGVLTMVVLAAGSVGACSSGAESASPTAPSATQTAASTPTEQPTATQTLGTVAPIATPTAPPAAAPTPETCTVYSISDAAPIYDLATGKKSDSAAYDDSFTVAKEPVTSAGMSFLEILSDSSSGMGILYDDTTSGNADNPDWDLQC